MTKPDLAKLIRKFFEQHLVSARGLSSHTVLAYRDAWKLLLQFACKYHRKTCTALVLEDITAEIVRCFLEHLERERKNGVHTRNNRLAAIHAFFQYLATTDPRHILQCESILSVPFERKAARVPEYLERDEVRKIFAETWPELLGAVRTRLGCAGLEMEAVASAWPRTEWVELWVLVRRRASWTRAKAERKRYAVI